MWYDLEGNLEKYCVILNKSLVVSYAHAEKFMQNFRPFNAGMMQVLCLFCRSHPCFLKILHTERQKLKTTWTSEPEHVSFSPSSYTFTKSFSQMSPSRMDKTHNYLGFAFVYLTFYVFG